MIGLKRGAVALFPHESEWEKEAERTIKKLKDILGEAALDIQHVGSTSVKTIYAKPIIDIAVGVSSVDEIMEYIEELEKSGFYHRPTDLLRQRLFASGSYYDGTGELQTHFIHVVEYAGKEWNDYINFRDYLNSNNKAAEEYEKLKRRLAKEAPVDSGREHYLAGKHDFIVNTLRKASVKMLLGKTVDVIIDRPIGTLHKGMTYPLNYGYIPGAFGGDGEEIDVYLLGVKEPVMKYKGRIIAVIYRKNDVEDKLICAPEGTDFTVEEIMEAVRFQEKWFDTDIEKI